VLVRRPALRRQLQPGLDHRPRPGRGRLAAVTRPDHRNARRPCHAASLESPSHQKFQRSDVDTRSGRAMLADLAIAPTHDWQRCRAFTDPHGFTWAALPRIRHGQVRPSDDAPSIGRRPQTHLSAFPIRVAGVSDSVYAQRSIQYPSPSARQLHMRPGPVTLPLAFARSHPCS
jgi:hypothetical protein